MWPILNAAASRPSRITVLKLDESIHCASVAGSTSPSGCANFSAAGGSLADVRRGTAAGSMPCSPEYTVAEHQSTQAQANGLFSIFHFPLFIFHLLKHSAEPKEMENNRWKLENGKSMTAISTGKLAVSETYDAGSGSLLSRPLQFLR